MTSQVLFVSYNILLVLSLLSTAGLAEDPKTNINDSSFTTATLSRTALEAATYLGSTTLAQNDQRIGQVSATTTSSPYTRPPSNSGGMLANIPACDPPADFTKSTLPQWYMDFWRLKENVTCTMPFFNWSADGMAAIAVDKTTFKEVPWQVQCGLNRDYARSKIIADYYHAFLGLTPGFGTNGSAMRIVQMMIFALTPLALFTFACGMYVIRKILKGSDSHLFVYHSVLIFADTCCYILDSTHCVSFAQWLSTPICYTSFCLAAVPFTNFVPLTWIAHESAAFGLSNLIQALLATDRAISLTAPLFYRSYVSARFAVKAIGIIMVINTIMWTGQLALTEPWLVFWVGASQSSAKYLSWKGTMAVFGGIRAVMFVGSWLVQLVGCIIVFCKVSALKRSRGAASEKAGKGDHNDISLVPCYLLIGTCIINLAGCTSMSLYMLMFNIITSFAQGWVGDINGNQLAFVPILNNLGFYIHCCVCRQYREEVSKLVVNTVRRTVAMVTCSKYEPVKGNAKIGSSSVSGHSMAHTGTTAAVSSVSKHAMASSVVDNDG